MNLTITIKDCQLLEKLEICNTALLAEKAQRYDMPAIDSHCIYYNKAGGSVVAWLERGGVWEIKLSPSGEEQRPWSTQELRPWP